VSSILIVATNVRNSKNKSEIEGYHFDSYFGLTDCDTAVVLYVGTVLEAHPA
jgi:hypothetical protein